MDKTREPFDATDFLTDQLKEELRQWIGEREENVPNYCTSESSESDDNYENKETCEKIQGINNVETIDENELELIGNFLVKGCGCTYGSGGSPHCTSFFNADLLSQLRCDSLELTRDELDLVILSHIRSSLCNSLNAGKGGKRERSHSCYWYEGRQICKKTFLFINSISHHRYKELLRHYKKNGLVSRCHGNKQRLPNNALSFEELIRFKNFMLNYASNRAIMLPGKYPGNKHRTS